MKHAVAISICAVGAVVCVSARSTSAAQIRSTIPVMIGGAEASEGCAGTALVTISTDSTLNMRAGPGTRHPVLARLAPGQSVTVCQRTKSGWVGVLVPRNKTGPRDCGASDAGPTPKAYTGACDSGWVLEKYLRIEAG